MRNYSLPMLTGLFFVFTAVFSPSNLMGMKYFKNFKKNTFFDLKASTLQKTNKRTIFNPTEYAGLDKAITCKKLRDQISIFNGIPFIESNFLKNIYTFGPQNHPQVQLINDPNLGFFHLLDNDLRTTQINPAAGLTPELTGTIISHLVKEDISSPSIREDIVKKWKKEYKTIRNTNITNNTLNKQYDLIVQAHEESKKKPQERIFPKNFGSSLLLAHLYRKGTKEDVVRYLKTVAQHFPHQINEQILDTNATTMYSSLKLTTHIKNLFPQYPTNNTTMEQCKNFFNNREKALAAQVHYLRTEMFMPLVLQQSYGYKGKPRVPDCFETAMRNLCNLLLWQPKSSEFNIDLIPSTLSPHTGFIDFYKKYAQHDSINTTAAGQAWMNLVSGHATLEYVNNDYEGEPLLSNVFSLLNILFGTNAQTFAELSTLLSTPERTVILEPEGENLTISITHKNIPEPLKGFLKIAKKSHASFSLNKQTNNNSSFNNVSYENYKYLFTTHDESKLQNAPLFLSTNSFTIKSLNAKPSPVHYTMNTYSHNLNDVNQLYSKIDDLCKGILHYPALTAVLQKVCLNAPHNDIHLMSSILANLHQNGLTKTNTWFHDFAFKHPMNLYTILHNCNYEELLDNQTLETIAHETKKMLLEGPSLYNNGILSQHFTDISLWHNAIFSGIKEFYTLYLNEIYHDTKYYEMLQYLMTITTDETLITKIITFIVDYNLFDKVTLHQKNSIYELIKKIKDEKNLVNLATLLILANPEYRIKKEKESELVPSHHHALTSYINMVVEQFSEKVSGETLVNLLNQEACHDLAAKLLPKVTIAHHYEMKKLAEIIIQKELYHNPIFQQHLIENPLSIYVLLENSHLIAYTKELLEPCSNGYLQFVTQGPDIYCQGRYKHAAENEQAWIKEINEQEEYTFFLYQGPTWDSANFRRSSLYFKTPLIFMIGADIKIPKGIILKLLSTTMGEKLFSVSLERMLHFAEYKKNHALINLLRQEKTRLEKLYEK